MRCRERYYGEKENVCWGVRDLENSTDTWKRCWILNGLICLVSRPCDCTLALAVNQDKQLLVTMGRFNILLRSNNRKTLAFVLADIRRYFKNAASIVTDKLTKLSSFCINAFNVRCSI